MYINSNADLRKAAETYQAQGKNWLSSFSDEAYDAARKLTKQFKKSYPQLAQDLKKSDFSRNATAKALEFKKAYPQVSQDIRRAASEKAEHLRKFLHSASKESYTVSHKVKTSLIKIGIAYGVFKLCSHSEELSAAGAKVKAHIKAKPIESAVIALGAGYIIAKILR